MSKRGARQGRPRLSRKSRHLAPFGQGVVARAQSTTGRTDDMSGRRHVGAERGSVRLGARPNPKARDERQVIGRDARQASPVDTKGLAPDGVVPVDAIQGP